MSHKIFTKIEEVTQAMGYFAEIQSLVVRIPRGRVATYGEIARAAGRPGTARQVAWALRGAGAEGIPWQRVVGQGGRILLPGEAGLHQRARLEREGVRFIGRRVDMRACSFTFLPKQIAKSLNHKDLEDRKDLF